MQARVAGTITFDRSFITNGQLRKLTQDLSFDNPEFIKRRMFGRWTGGTPKKICLLREHGKPHPHATIEIPRGASGALCSVMGGLDAVEWIDDRVEKDPVDLVPSIVLRDYQKTALDRMITARQGTIIFPCGAGKTVTALAAICAIGQPALVIVHTKDLLEQWCDQIRELVGIEPGIYGGGKKHIGEITVATVQTLVRMPAEALGELARWFGCVVVDEAHHVPASTFQEVVSQIPAKYRFGLTATPTREDGLTPLLRMTMGAELFAIDYQQLIERGHLAQPEIKIIETGFDFDYFSVEDHQPCMAALCEDEDRNELIADLAAADAADGHSVLILSDRVEHCKSIQRKMWHVDAAQSALVLTGDAKAKDRAVILEAFKNGTAKVLIATTLADEGLDVPRLSRVILAYPGKSAARTIQRLGRIMRVFPGKGTPILYDLVDKNVPVLWRQALKRGRTYRMLLEVET